LGRLREKRTDPPVGRKMVSPPLTKRGSPVFRRLRERGRGRRMAIAKGGVKAYCSSYEEKTSLVKRNRKKKKTFTRESITGVIRNKILYVMDQHPVGV